MSACIPPSPRTACSISPIRGEGAGGNATTVARAELGDGGLRDVTTIFEALPRAPGGLHFGSRIAFDRAGLMYVTTGERYNKPRAQDLGDLGGKVVRLRDDGTVPPDNPFVGRAGARPEIFSWGHRNPQGLAVHPETGKIWEVEHGPRGGDELNILKAGANYGWPLATARHRLRRLDHQPEQEPARHGGSDAHLGAVDLALRPLLSIPATSSRAGRARCSPAACRPTRCSASSSTASAMSARNG